MTTRSRTGCMTCRKRKLKCDELRPICRQCSKAGKECIPSIGLVFRNQQNPSLNSAGGSDGSSGGTLSSFYSYKNTFNDDTVWVDIPSTVEFVQVTDPYADDNDGTGLSPAFPRRATASYQNIASHSLEALSTAATANSPPYGPQSTYPDQDGAYAPFNGSHAEYLSSRHSVPSGSTAAHQHNNNISFLLNPTSSLSSVIDPNLESSLPLDGNQPETPNPPRSPRTIRKEAKGDPESDNRVAYLLRNFSDTSGQ